MNTKSCIFTLNKTCTNCNECNICELNRGKICNNCGKCLEMEGYDTKAIEINNVFENSDYAEEGRVEEGRSSHNDILDKILEQNPNIKKEDIKIEYLEDIEGLKDLIQDEQSTKELMNEAFPGLYVFNKNNS